MPNTRHLSVTITIWTLLGSLSACGSLIDDSNGASEGGKGDNYAVSSAIQSICQVKVDNTTRNVEDDYLPHVLFCEVGKFTNAEEWPSLQGAPLAELLKAQAIAARTFMHSRLAWRSSMSGTTDDQVYSGRHCRGALPQSIVDAVQATRGLVMLRPSGDLHAGYYRAGRSFACNRYNTCDGEPCMGQTEAAGCARDGFSTKQILSMYYGRVNVVQTAGSCGSGQGPIADAEASACYFGAQKGTCQENTLHCNGHYASDLCGGGPTNQCCLPPEPGEGEICQIGEQTGTCGNVLFGSCATGFKAGHCPGSDNVQCCLDAASAAPEPTGGEPAPVVNEPAPAVSEPEPVSEPAPQPEPSMRWIGEPCMVDSDCLVPGVWQGICSAGFCSTSCDRYCPDLQQGPSLVTGPITRLIRPATFCASIGLGDGATTGFCYSRRDHAFFADGGCPAGTTARLVSRTNQSSVKRNICVPNAVLTDPGKGDDAIIGEAPTTEGDALDLKQGGGCSVPASSTADPGAPMPWLLLLALAMVRSRQRHHP